MARSGATVAQFSRDVKDYGPNRLPLDSTLPQLHRHFKEYIAPSGGFAFACSCKGVARSTGSWLCSI